VARKLIVEIVGDASSLERSYARATKSTRRFGKDMQRMGRGAVVASVGFRGLGRSVAFASGAFLGGAGLTAAFKSTIDAAMEAQRVEAQLTNVLNNQGKATEANLQAINARSEALAEMSGFDDELITQTFTAFERQTNNITKAMRLNAIAVDVARGRNIDLQTAANLVTKASIGMAGALRRVGINARAGASATELLDLLQRRFAGSAEAYGQTAAGAQDRFRVALENTQEVLGRIFLPKLTDALNKATEWLNNQENQKKIQDAANESVEKGTGFVEGLANAYHKVTGFVGDLRKVDPFGGWSGRIQMIQDQLDWLDQHLPRFLTRLAEPTPDPGWEAFFTAIRDLGTAANVRSKLAAVEAGITAISEAGQIPAVVSGTGFAGRPLTPAEQLDILLAADPNNVQALKQRRAMRQRAYEFAMSEIHHLRGNTANFAKAAARAAGDIATINERLKSIAQEKADAAEADRQAVLDAIGTMVSGSGIAPGAFEAARATFRLPARLSGFANALNVVQRAQLRLLEPPAPSARALRRRAANLARRIRGTPADTPANRGILARVGAAFALGDPRGEVATRIRDMLDSVAESIGELGPNRIAVAVAPSIGRLTRGLNLNPADLRQLRFNLAGANLTLGPHGAVRGGGPVVIDNRMRVDIDGRQVALATRRHAVKAQQRTSTQTRGRQTR